MVMVMVMVESGGASWMNEAAGGGADGGVGGGGGDTVFTSTNNLPILAELEGELVSHLEDFLTNTQHRLDIISRYVSEYKEELGGRFQDTDTENGKEKFETNEPRLRGNFSEQQNIINSKEDDDEEEKKFGAGVKGDKEWSVTERSFHPVSSFLLLRRLAVDWSDVEKTLQVLLSSTRGVVREVGGAITRSGVKLPVPSDLHVSALALVRLQYTYDLDLTSLKNGTILTPARGQLLHEEIHDGGQLRCQDCLYLSKVAMSEGHLPQASDWLRIAQEATHHEPNSAAVRKDILTYQNVVHKLRNTEEELKRQAAEETIRHTHQSQENQEKEENDNENEELKESNQNATLTQKDHEEEVEVEVNEAEDHERYLRLCRGEQLMSSSEVSQLVCRLARPSPSHHLLAPLLVEEVSHRPHIVLIHHFLTRNQTRRLAAAATPKLEESRHRGPEGGFVISSVRTSKTAWLRDNTLEAENNTDDDRDRGLNETGDAMGRFLRQLTRRIEAATRLHALLPSAAEDYQVASYGVGGMYKAHSDYLMTSTDQTLYTEWERHIGDRLATFLIYLSEVGGGGATVFPRAGVGVWPQQGTAVLWWNLDAAGRGDPNTWHAACPVIYGTKWICNKWVHYNDQFLRHSCGLHPTDKITFP
ncbi:hypothetical protein Pmani_015163 [Petrolisthes manimaculis]|uniref:procollagen-proline 4-dioxygenase n=1 Tax=Petrolisthes manimaculis TaxID=1843537 RepID=A0AAE1PRH1_9EUCA|nr:hypothetical protein Pmani_015163 [Petrolisthes manimaculis]